MGRARWVLTGRRGGQEENTLPEPAEFEAGASRAAQGMFFLASAAISGHRTPDQATAIPCGQPLGPT